jgi:hypothetical protein
MIASAGAKAGIGTRDRGSDGKRKRGRLRGQFSIFCTQFQAVRSEGFFRGRFQVVMSGQDLKGQFQVVRLEGFFEAGARW